MLSPEMHALAAELLLRLLAHASRFAAAMQKPLQQRQREVPCFTLLPPALLQPSYFQLLQMLLLLLPSCSTRKAVQLLFAPPFLNYEVSASLTAAFEAAAALPFPRDVIASLFFAAGEDRGEAPATVSSFSAGVWQLEVFATALTLHAAHVSAAQAEGLFVGLLSAFEEAQPSARSSQRGAAGMRESLLAECGSVATLLFLRLLSCYDDTQSIASGGAEGCSGRGSLLQRREEAAPKPPFATAEGCMRCSAASKAAASNDTQQQAMHGRQRSLGGKGGAPLFWEGPLAASRYEVRGFASVGAALVLLAASCGEEEEEKDGDCGAAIAAFAAAASTLRFGDAGEEDAQKILRELVESGKKELLGSSHRPLLLLQELRLHDVECLLLMKPLLPLLGSVEPLLSGFSSVPVSLHAGAFKAFRPATPRETLLVLHMHPLCSATASLRSSLPGAELLQRSLQMAVAVLPLHFWVAPVSLILLGAPPPSEICCLPGGATPACTLGCASWLAMLQLVEAATAALQHASDSTASDALTAAWLGSSNANSGEQQETFWMLLLDAFVFLQRNDCREAAEGPLSLPLIFPPGAAGRGKSSRQTGEGFAEEEQQQQLQTPQESENVSQRGTAAPKDDARPTMMRTTTMTRHVSSRSNTWEAPVSHQQRRVMPPDRPRLSAHAHTPTAAAAGRLVSLLPSQLLILRGLLQSVIACAFSPLPRAPFDGCSSGSYPKGAITSDAASPPLPSPTEPLSQTQQADEQLETMCCSLVALLHGFCSGSGTSNRNNPTSKNTGVAAPAEAQLHHLLAMCDDSGSQRRLLPLAMCLSSLDISRKTTPLKGGPPGGPPRSLYVLSALSLLLSGDCRLALLQPVGSFNVKFLEQAFRKERNGGERKGRERKRGSKKEGETERRLRAS
ncbi:phosphatidylinositol 3-and 4-kinase domain-containing protein [Cyclospora cayetanensis]|uniref:Phosphatidylinositol 3-and 4-kinase domain-containing protein n=1 Tax=Cyclospora cayetanensis TaxID=88456 RepID=A0A1D3D7R5_9EIME|nr:phosphatidylinositol 3-and 4-kinase domain-containing protein [Cyclospora cayetanensis]